MNIRSTSSVPVLSAGDGGSVAPKAEQPKTTTSVEAPRSTALANAPDALPSKTGIDSAATTKANLNNTAKVTADSPNEVLVKQPQIKAMLDLIASAEGTGTNYGKVVNGKVDSLKPGAPETSKQYLGKSNVSITDYRQHPGILVEVQPPGSKNHRDGLYSTAAGRYQFIKPTWEGLQQKLHLPDFSSASQDLAAIQLMKDKGMIESLLKGDLKTAVTKGSDIWASLPKADGKGAYVGQNAKNFDDLQKVYNDSLKKYTPETPKPATPPTTTPATPPTTTPTKPAAPTTVIPPSGLSKNPSKNQAVDQLHDNYVKLGLMTQAQKETGASVFSNITESATKVFQQSMGIPTTGKFDDLTRVVMTDLYAGNIKRGAQDEGVIMLQQKLSQTNPSFAAAIKAESGKFGKATEDALKAFQKNNNIQQTGVLGPTTYKAMYGSKTVSTPVTTTPTTNTPKPADLAAHHLNQLDGDIDGIGNNNCGYASTHMALSFLGVKGYQVLNPTATSTKDQITALNKQNYNTTMALRKAGGQGTSQTNYGHIVDTLATGNPGVVKAANSIDGVSAVSLYDSVTNLKQEDRHTSYLNTMQTAFENGEKTAFIVGGSPRLGWGDDATKNAAYSRTSNRPYAGAHFVAVVGYDAKTKLFDVLDPIADYPIKVTSDQLNKYMNDNGAMYREIAQITVK